MESDAKTYLLVSIKPIYTQQILKGIKRFEYRKSQIKRKVDGIIIYATSPVKKIVGYAQLKQILTSSPDEIWFKTHKYGGIAKSDYTNYFADSPMAVAYELTNVVILNEAKPLSEIDVKSAPQSYRYIDLTEKDFRKLF